MRIVDFETNGACFLDAWLLKEIGDVPLGFRTLEWAFFTRRLVWRIWFAEKHSSAWTLVCPADVVSECKPLIVTLGDRASSFLIELHLRGFNAIVQTSLRA